MGRQSLDCNDKIHDFIHLAASERNMTRPRTSSTITYLEYYSTGSTCVMICIRQWSTSFESSSWSFQ